MSLGPAHWAYRVSQDLKRSDGFSDGFGQSTQISQVGYIGSRCAFNKPFEFPKGLENYGEKPNFGGLGVPAWTDLVLPYLVIPGM